MSKIAAGIPTTKKGKNKDQYGRKFGKKHNEAMFEFTKTLWLQDATSSLRNILQIEAAQQAFLDFLKTEYGEAQLEFFLEAQKLEKMDPTAQAAAALQTFNMFMAGGGKGIGQQQRLASTQEMWDQVNSGGATNGVDGQTAMVKIREEAETTLKMLAFDAFPRFIKSPFCQKAMDAIKATGNTQLEGMINQVDQKAPQDADDWLNNFVSTAESFPACIVISDMTIPGAPMVFVNQEFCRTTGYGRDEAVGRNCRFLQGPDTEPEAIQVIRNTLSKGQDCHVKLTNYKKNGELFQNLLSMKPVFDADGIYRYVIGVQFEIKDDNNLKQRLVQLDKLLRLLPSKLPLRSKASSRAKGKLAANVTGEANQLIAQKNEVLAMTKDEGAKEDGQRRPKALATAPMEVPMSQLNLDNTVYAFTKIMWLGMPNDVMQAIIMDQLGRETFERFVKATCHLYHYHFDFLCKFLQVASSQPGEQPALIRKFHRKRFHNSLFYCCATEIEYGSLDTMNWGPVFQEMGQKSQISLAILTSELLPRFLNSKMGQGLIAKVRAREIQGIQAPLRTVAAGLDKNSESFWLDMFRVMSETVSVGCVVADMTIPGVCLTYINEGFRTHTGYGKEKVGCNCRFLQGKETEDYLNDEIMASLQHAEPLITKLHNYKADGTKFQCLLALHPVMGPGNEYKYQVGVQIDYKMGPDITRQLFEMERILRYLPRNIEGTDTNDLLKIMPSTVMGDSCVFPLVSVDPSEVNKAAPGGGMGGGMGGFGGMGGGMGGFGGMGGMGGFGAPAAAPVAAPTGKDVEVMEKGKDVVTKKGKGKDQYGRAFGKKQKAAMLEFTKTLWLQDATGSLRNLLQLEAGQTGFMNFLKTEYGEAQLEFFLEAQKLEKMDAASQATKAADIYKTFMAAGGKGIGQQERTAATQEMWDRMNSTGSGGVDTTQALNKIREEADTTLKMLAFDAFPRFVKSKECIKCLEQIKGSGGNTEIENMLGQAGSKGPQDADDWLNNFVATAESFPACIVISDMTIPGAPMVFVNQEFCKTTGYAREEATGRNCRFLQGPATEPEAIQVIRNTLSKGQDCHVKLTNYKKNGELFQNLLSMKPVFDADGIYRYVIGVQFEIKDDNNLKQRLVQLDKLLRLLPSKLPLRSKASSRAKGKLAANVTGEANAMIANKEAILQQAKQMEVQELAANQNRPKSLVSVSSYDSRSLNYDRTIAAFTKIMWQQDPVAACRAILIDPMCFDYVMQFAEGSCSPLVQTHLKFFKQATGVRLAQGAAQVKKLRAAHLKKNYNPIFYCTTTEIVYGTINNMNWGPIFEQTCLWQEQSTFFLASEAFQRYLEHPSSIEMITKLRQRELAGEQLPCRTCAFGVNPQSETYWLDMFKNMSETVSLGMIISEMTIPGIPIAYINEGFRVTTGYGKEKIGCNPRFLQGKETENYLNDEIMAALQQSEPLVTKLHNYKADGTKFQCLLALHPVFGPAPDTEYKFQIGMQIDFNNNDPDLPRKISEMGRILRLLPQTVGGEPLPGVPAAIAEMENFFNKPAAAAGGHAPAAPAAAAAPAGGFGGMGGFAPQPPASGPPSFASPRPW